MYKKTISIALALIMALSLLTITASAAGGKWGLEDVEFTDTRGNKVTIPGGSTSCAVKVVSFTPGNPWTSDSRAMDSDDTLGAPDYDPAPDINYLNLGAQGVLVLEFGVYVYDGPGNDIYVFEVGPDVEATKVEVSNDLKTWIYVGDADGSISGVDLNGKVPTSGRYKYVRITDIYGASSTWPGADIDAVAFVNVTPFNNSGWADAEIEGAFDTGLIPNDFFGTDLTANMTRAEFCLLAVTLYEKVTGTTITGRVKFTDTTDVNVEKAAFIGVVNGVGNDRFDPEAALTREQAATMLARLAESVSKPLDKKAATFGDKGSVSTWALEAVGQCEATEIMGGTGNNQFSPKGPYQRQQSIATITRMYDYLDGKGTPNHAMEVTTTTTPPAPEQTTPTSGNIDTDLVGVQWFWYSNILRVNLYFNSKGEFTEECVNNNLNAIGSVLEVVYKGVYSISNNTITLTYKSAYRRMNSSYQWESDDLPENTSLTYKTDFDVFDTVSKVIRDNLYINGAIPPYEKPFNGDDTNFQINWGYSGDKMGSLRNDGEYSDDVHPMTNATYNTSLKWPTESLPNNLPIYDKGRVRDITVEDGTGYIRIGGMADGYYKSLNMLDTTIFICDSSEDDVIAYIEKAIQSGWSLVSPDDNSKISVEIENQRQCHLMNDLFDELYIQMTWSGLVKIWARKVID